MDNAANMIFCVGNTPAKDEAFLSFAETAGIPVKRLLGSYKGTVETSFEVPARYADQILPLVRGEESVLLLDGDLSDKPNATLFYPATFDEEPIGTVERVTKEQAEKLDAWTLDLSTGEFYAAV